MLYISVLAMVKSPGEVIAFLNQHRESHIKHCNVKIIRFDLKRGRVISQGQREQLDYALSVADANDLFYQFLHDDPAPKTLEAAAKVLKEAPNTTNMNKRFAKVIEDFLSLPGGYICVNISVTLLQHIHSFGFPYKNTVVKSILKYLYTTYINIFFLVSRHSNGKNASPPVDPNQSTPVSVHSVAMYI